MLLAALSVFIGLRRCIELKKDNWTEYPLLWIAVVARSGERKTPVFSKVMAPVQAKQSELFAEYVRQKERYKKDKHAPEPVFEQIVTTDATIEAMKWVLESSPKGILFSSDELSGWVRGIASTKEARETTADIG